MTDRPVLPAAKPAGLIEAPDDYAGLTPPIRYRRRNPPASLKLGASVLIDGGGHVTGGETRRPH